MKSRTSFFNKTALKKDIVRYYPIWGLYTIFLLLVLFGLSDDSAAGIADNLLDTLQGMAWINLLYGGVCGAFLFMDLFNGRLCNGLHALPLRREGWLVTHILSGVLFGLVPNLLLSLLSGVIAWEYGYVALIWLGVSMLQYLFFFGTAVLSAVCAGNLVGMIAVYGIIHFVTMLIYAVANILYQPLLHGIQFYTADFYQYFPLYKFSEFQYADFKIHYSEMAASAYANFNGLEPEAWRYAVICAVMGAVSAVLAWLVYRRRHLETAGDFLSLRPLAPVFLVICTVGAGSILYLFSDLFNSSNYFFLALGMVIGYFAGRMLLDRTVRVFGKRSLLGFGVLVIVLAGSMVITWLDPVGITRYVPPVQNVECATIVGADKGGVYSSYSMLSYVDTFDLESYEITDSEEITDLQDFHRQMICYRPDTGDGTQCDVQVVYRLKDGRIVKRYYEVGRDTALGEQAGRYFSDMRYLFEVNDISVLYNAFESVTLDSYTAKVEESIKLTDSQQIAGLLDAIKADCEAGVMAQIWAYHDKVGEAYYLEFNARDAVLRQNGWEYGRFYLRVWSDCTNTMAYLNQIKVQHALAQQ